jgi:hypothetical protein
VTTPGGIEGAREEAKVRCKQVIAPITADVLISEVASPKGLPLCSVRAHLTRMTQLETSYQTTRRIMADAHNGSLMKVL